MEAWISDTGQKVWVHNREHCEGSFCCIHNPSNHHMRDWPMLWRDDRGLMERICECGVGHPDPDDLAFKADRLGSRAAETEGVHGCCGCCFEKPSGPLGRIIREGDTGKMCRECGSSCAKAKWYSRKSRYCINPECPNYLIRALVKSRWVRFKAFMRKHF